MIAIILLSLAAWFSVLVAHVENDAFLSKLREAQTVNNRSIESIYNEWSVREYPLFLKSCFMHKSSWEIMKFKLMSRIISAFESKEKKSFVISFLGRLFLDCYIIIFPHLISIHWLWRFSSVTAGHDSPFNVSTPVVTGEMMQDSFQALNIFLDSRNGTLYVFSAVY